MIKKSLRAYNTRDIEDVTSIMNQLGKTFDRKRVEQDLESLAEQAESPEWLDRWLQLKKER